MKLLLAAAAVVALLVTPSAGRSAECDGHSTVTVTHAAPRPALYDQLPMFERPNRHWTPRRARKLLDIRLGPALIGVHIDHVRDLGIHSGVHFQAVPVADPVLGGPAECAPEYDPETAEPTPGVCLAWWPDQRTPRNRARDCFQWLDDGAAMGTIPLGKRRVLAYWLLPAGRRHPMVIPTRSERRAGMRPIRFERIVGQFYLARATRWPFRSFDYRWTENGTVVRRAGAGGS